MNKTKWIESVGAWGASTVYGAGDEDARGWVGCLQCRLEHDHATAVYNRGVSGETSVDLLKRFAVELQSIEPQLVLIHIGVNDSIFIKGDENHRAVSVEAYKANLKKLFTIAKTAAPHVFAVGVTKANDAITQPFAWSSDNQCYSNRVLHEYDQTLEQIAREMNVEYIKMWDVLEVQDIPDGIHPNATGYQKMYERIHAAIKPLLA